MFSSGRLFKLTTQQQFLLYWHYFLKLTRPGAKHLSFPHLKNPKPYEQRDDLAVKPELIQSIVLIFSFFFK